MDHTVHDFTIEYKFDIQREFSSNSIYLPRKIEKKKNPFTFYSIRSNERNFCFQVFIEIFVYLNELKSIHFNKRFFF